MEIKLYKTNEVKGLVRDRLKSGWAIIEAENMPMIEYGFYKNHAEDFEAIIYSTKIYRFIPIYMGKKVPYWESAGEVESIRIIQCYNHDEKAVLVHTINTKDDFIDKFIKKYFDKFEVPFVVKEAELDQTSTHEGS